MICFGCSMLVRTEAASGSSENKALISKDGSSSSTKLQRFSIG